MKVERNCIAHKTLQSNRQYNMRLQRLAIRGPGRWQMEEGRGRPFRFHDNFARIAPGIFRRRRIARTILHSAEMHRRKPGRSNPPPGHAGRQSVRQRSTDRRSLCIPSRPPGSGACRAPRREHTRLHSRRKHVGRPNTREHIRQTDRSTRSRLMRLPRALRVASPVTKCRLFRHSEIPVCGA